MGALSSALITNIPAPDTSFVLFVLIEAPYSKITLYSAPPRSTIGLSIRYSPLSIYRIVSSVLAI